MGRCHHPLIYLQKKDSYKFPSHKDKRFLDLAPIVDCPGFLDFKIHPYIVHSYVAVIDECIQRERERYIM